MERFFGKLEKTDSCWIWKAAIRGKSGYGCMKFNGKTVDAHRISWIIHYGQIPNRLFVCHKCDNRKCVNPDHLFLGTQSDNMKDCFEKGRLFSPSESRFKIGHKATNASISKERAEELKMVIKHKGSKSLKKVSEDENVAYQLLRDINCQRVYK